MEINDENTFIGNRRRRSISISKIDRLNINKSATSPLTINSAKSSSSINKKTKRRKDKYSPKTIIKPQRARSQSTRNRKLKRKKELSDESEIENIEVNYTLI